MKIKNIYSIPFFVLVSVLVSLRPVGFDRDSVQYFSASMANNFDFRWIEPSFAIISLFNREFLGGSAFGLFFVYSIVAIKLKHYAFSLLTPYVSTSMFLYFSSFFLLLELTQIRFAVAASFMLWALSDLYRGFNKRFFIKIGIAVFFHYSSLVYVVIYFISKMKFNRLFWALFPFSGLLLSILIGSGFWLNFMPGFLQAKISYYLSSESPPSLFSFYRIFSIVLYFFFLYMSDRISDGRYFFYFKIYSFSIFIYFAMSSLPAVFSVRFSGMFSLVLVLLIPYMFSCFKNKFFVLFIVLLYSILNLFYLIFIVGIFDFTAVL